MTQMLRRPPAKELYRAPQEGPTFARVGSVGAVDSAISYGSPEGGRHGGRIDFRAGVREIVYVWQDLLQINPAHEQPRLDFTSARQPIVRMGAMRRYSRTFMSASPRFFGRWFYIGQIQRQYTERGRITGVATRLGTTYSYPRWTTGPRTIQLGGKG